MTWGRRTAAAWRGGRWCRPITLGTAAVVVLALAGADTGPAAAPGGRTLARLTPAVVVVPGRGPTGFIPSGTVDGAGAPPTRVRIPAIQVDSPLDPLHLDATGALEVPKSYTRAGWYADGAAPGEVGPAVIAGHVDSTTGPAVFARLDRLHPGDVVEVERAGTWIDFRVVEVGRYRKDAFPTTRVYGPTPDPQLRLITCSGAFNSARRSYVDNTVVYAVAA